MLTITFGIPGDISRSISLLETQSPQTQTLAIQTALDEVANYPGGYVQLSIGTFRLDGTVHNQNGILCVGQTTVIRGAGIGVTMLSIPAHASPFRYRSRTNCSDALAAQIEHLTIEIQAKALVAKCDNDSKSAVQLKQAEVDASVALRSVKIYDVSQRTLDLPVCVSSSNSAEILLRYSAGHTPGAYRASA